MRELGSACGSRCQSAISNTAAWPCSSDSSVIWCPARLADKDPWSGWLSLACYLEREDGWRVILISQLLIRNPHQIRAYVFPRNRIPWLKMNHVTRFLISHRMFFLIYLRIRLHRHSSDISEFCRWRVEGVLQLRHSLRLIVASQGPCRDQQGILGALSLLLGLLAMPCCSTAWMPCLIKP